VISGEPGIGKTRLMEALAEEAKARRFRIARADNYEYVRSPFGPFADALGTLLPDYPETLPRSASDRSALLSLTGMGETDSRSPLDYRRLFVVMAEILERIGERQPWLLLIDDVQWADPESLDFIRFLAPRLTTMAGAMVASARATHGEQTDIVQLLARIPGLRRLDLPPLTDAESRALVTSAERGTARLSQSAVDTITARAEGNPLFIEELTREVAAPTGNLQSTTVRHAIAARLTRLEATPLRVLEAASALGRQFTIDHLARVCRLDSDLVVDSLRAARDASLINESADGQFQFRHELIRATTYERLLKVERKRLHRIIADMLEADGGGSNEQLALHRLAAGDLARGAAAAEAAGDDATRMNAIASARDRYVEADQTGEFTDDAKARLDGKLARAYQLLGDAGSAVSRHAAAARYYESVGEFELSDHHWLQYANVAYRAGQVAQAFEACESIIKKGRAPIGEFGARSLYAMLLAFEDRHEAARAQIEKAEALRTLHNLEDSIPLVYAQLTVARSSPDNAWIGSVQSAVSLAEQAGDPAGLAHALINHGIIASERGRDAEAMAALDRAIELSERNGLVLATAYAKCVVIRTHGLAGRLDDAYRTIVAVSGLHVEELALRLLFAEAAVPVLADLGEIHRFPSIADEELARDAVAAWDSRRYVSMVSTQLYKAAALRHEVDEVAIGHALGAVQSAKYLEFPMLTFARFAGAEHFPRIRELVDSTPYAAGRLRTYRKLTMAILAVRTAQEDASKQLRDARDDAFETDLPLCAALALELLGNSKDAVNIYERCGARAQVARILARTTGLLTKRESEIADLVVKGSSNRAIAEALSLSERTVEHHVASILRKLDIKGRADLPARYGGSSDTDTT
jgi:DNA-binding CsgD family transcriptional regulator/tetratricopeptide (TPR) repeat protein